MSYVFRCSVFLALLITAIGCGRSAGPSGWRTGTVPDAGGGGGEGSGSGSGFIGHQGRPLMALVDGDVRLAKLQEVLDEPHVTSDGELVANGVSGTDLVGVTFDASAPEETDAAMRIAHVFPPSEPGARWQYALERREPTTGAWEPACIEPQPIIPPTVPPISPPRAYAMNGAWERDGMYLATADNISFACTSGAIGKCIEWGYPPEATPPTVTEHGLPTTVTGADLLQACTRMARADFCVAGYANTLDGTPIRYDDIFRTPPSPDGSPFRFEAAWAGVAVTGGPPQRPAPICLSKLRWSTLQLGGGCSVQLPDPRTDPKGQFCENMTPQQLEQAGALVYSSSLYLDAGLYSYTIPSTRVTLTTSSLQPGPVGEMPTWKVPPPVPLVFPVAGEQVQLEATIFAPQLPPEMSHLGLMLLSSYLCNLNELVTTTAPPAAGCTKIADEGYVWPPNTPGHTPLRRWTELGGHKSRTNATAASTVIKTGLQLAEVVGGALRAVADLNIRWSTFAGAGNATIDIKTRTGDWIKSCASGGSSGSSGGLYTYTGVCPGTGTRVDRTDITAVRVNSATATGLVSAIAAYDGIDTDLYVALPGGTPTAVTVTWNEVAPGTRYALSILRAPGNFSLCVPDTLIANSTSHVLTGTCANNQGVNLPTVQRVRVCTAPVASRCGDQPYNGVQSRIAIQL